MKIEEMKQNNLVYKVKFNENLSAIATKFNTTVETLKIENNLSEVEFGDVIIIPQKNLAVHVVRPAETISDIAKKYSTTINHIKNSNKLTSNNLFIGQKLII